MMPISSDLAGLRQATRPFSSQLAEPQTIREMEDAAAAQHALTSNEFGQGLMRGRRGLSSAVRNWGANLYEAAGGDATQAYADAARQQELAKLESPDLLEWKDVHGLGDAGNYALGAMGQMLPQLAPAVAGGGLGAAFRLGNAGRFAATMAPMHPMMAGGAVERMRADPVTAGMDPAQMSRSANLEGLASGAVGALPIFGMQGRAAGLAPFAAKARGPLGTAAGIAGDTALSMGAMGAGNVVQGEIGRGVQRAYNPAYAPQPDDEARKEEFMMGALGAAPMVVPHAVAGRTLGAGMEPLKRGGEMLAKGAKDIGTLAFEKVVEGGQYTADKLTPHAADIAAAARAAYTDQIAAGEPPITAAREALRAASDAAAAVVAATAKAGVDKASELTTKATTSDPFQTALAQGRKASQKVRNVFGLDHEAKTKVDADALRTLTDVPVKELDEAVSKLAQEHGLDTAEYDAATTPEAKADIADALFKQAERSKKNISTILPENKPTRELKSEPEESRQRDVTNASVRDAFKDMNISKDTLGRVLKGVQTRNLIKDGATVTMQKIHKALVDEGVLKADDNWARRTPLYARIEDALREIHKKHSPTTHFELGTDHVAGPFKNSIHDLVLGLAEKHPFGDVPAEKITDQVVSFVDGLANGREDITPKNAHNVAAELLKHYGDDGRKLLNDIVSHAEARWGKNSEQFQRVASLRESAGSVDAITQKLQPLLHDSARKVAPESLLTDMMHDWETIQSKAAERDGKIRELKQTIKEKEAAGLADEAYKAKTDLMRIEKETPDPVAAFREQYHRFLKDDASVEKVIKLVKDYEQSSQRLTAPDDKQPTTGSSKPPAVDPDNIGAVEGAGKDAILADEKLLEKRRNETAVADQEEGTPTYLGADSAFHNSKAAERKGARNVVEAPLTRHPSPDYPNPKHKGMAGAAIENIAATHAEHRVADVNWIRMEDWAKEAAADHGKHWKQLLTEAMEASLAHDKARLKALAGKGQSVAEFERFVKRRAELAAELKADKTLRAENVGRNFWEDPANVHFGYWKAQQSAAKNLAITPEHIQGLFGPHEKESVAEYAARRAEKEGLTGTAKRDGTKVPPREIVERSMLPVDLQVGRGADKRIVKANVDVAFLVRNLMEHHQKGDIIGTGSEETPTAAVRHNAKTDAPQTIHTTAEIAAAVYNTLTTLATTRNIVNAKNLFGNLPDNMIVYRGPEGNLTMRALRETRSVNAEGKVEYREKAIYPDKLDAIAQPFKRTPDAAAKADAAAKQGVLVGVLSKEEKGKLTRYNLDANALIKEVMVVNGMDPVEFLRPENGISDKHAAQLLREGLQMLERDYGMKLDRETFGMTNATDTQVRLAGDNAVVFKRFYGDKETGKAEPVTFKKLMDTDTSGGKYPTSMVDAKIAEALDLVRDTTANVERIKNLKADSKDGAWKPSNDLTRAKDRMKRAEQSEGFSTGQPEDLNKANQYSAEETQNARLGQIVKELKQIGGEVPLFDAATGELFDHYLKAFDTLLQSKKAGELSAHEQMVLREERGYGNAPTMDAGKPLTSEARSAGKSTEGMAKPQAPLPEGKGVVEARIKELTANAETVKALGSDVEKALAKIRNERLRDTTPEDVGHETVGGAKKELLPEPAKPGAEFAPTPKETTPVSGTRTNAEPSTMTAAAAASKAKVDLAAPHRDNAVTALTRVAGKLGVHGPLLDGIVDKLVDGKQYQELVRYIGKIELAVKDGSMEPDAAREALGLPVRIPAKGEAKAEPVRALKRGDEEFSKQKVGDVAQDIDADVQKTFHSLLPKEAGFSVETAKDGLKSGASGEFHNETRKAVVSAFASDSLGATNHEAWHGVENLLRTMGKEGQRVLDAVWKHVDTPAMREALLKHYGDDAGIVEQLRGASPSERAAFAFQAFRNNAKLELAPQTRNLFQKAWDWIKRVVKMSTSTDQAKAESFFQYVADSGLLKDFDNPVAVLKGLNETRGDKFAAHVKDAVAPIQEGLAVIGQHTAERVKAMGLQPATDVIHAYEGETGKGGWQNAYAQAANEFANEIARTLHGMDDKQQKDWMWSDKGRAFRNKLEKYAIEKLEATKEFKEGEVDKLVDRAYANTFVIDEMKVHDNMQEFINDLTNHGGLSGGSGLARDVANQMLEDGMHFNPAMEHKLFAKRPDLQVKWGDRSAEREITGAIRNVVRLATRAEFFGKEDRKIKEASEYVKTHGTAEQQKTFKNAMAAYEGRLGAEDMSPGVKKVMSAIMVANNIRLLPLAIFTQMMDAPQLALRKNEPGRMLDVLGRGLLDLPRAFDKADAGYAVTRPRELAEQFGMSADRHLGSVLSGIHTGFRMTGRVGKMNEGFFKWTLQEQWNRSLHEIATGHAVEFLRDHHNSNDPHSKRWMKELGLEKGDVKFSSKDTFEGLNWESEKVKRAVNQYVREALALPDVGSNALWMNDQRMALLAQLKKFQFAHDRYILQRGIREFKMDNKSMPLMLLAGSMGVQYATSQMKYALTGGPPAAMKNWGYSDYLTRALEQSAAGRWNFFMDTKDAITHGSSPFESLAGPSVEGAGRLVHALQKGNENVIETLFGNSGALVFPE